MITTLQGLTVATRVQPGQENALQHLLQEIGASVQQDGGRYTFRAHTTTHFASWVLIDAEYNQRGQLLPAWLLLMTTFTGSRREHLDELVRGNGAALHQVYQHCEKSPHDASEAGLRRYLQRHLQATTTYAGYQYISKEDVTREQTLRETLEDFLDAHPELRSETPVAIRQRLQDHVRATPALQWAVTPFRRSFASYWNLFGSLWLFGGVLGILLLLSLVALFIHHPLTIGAAIVLGGFFLYLVGLLLVLRLTENQPYAPIPRQTDEQIYQIASRETYPVINEMTVIGPLKRGWVRPLFLATTLWLVRFVRGFNYISTVHAARWLQLDGGRRIVFVAYFDNTSEGYAHDFVDSKKRTRNMNLIFGHGQGFPPTRWAMLGGGQDSRKYMQTVRASQKITQVWYYTHPLLSITNVTNNHELRKGLFGDLNDAEVSEWLLRL
ncbi:hypothetical protein SAMN05421823_103728 [Catalinimonas alkaloidigena]|uniref:Uncharacterized protein n=1 Tax=Catalinimonas alkaloidigena TaxID=1075417 RepID=A0A1G9FBF7_9BACT|nr:hypothetical protein [Catalinimonas alkaloidigena]SDK85681.1 hypothetical protein SAMN05421823_103728 [Catalinimonas alkaloidigena]